MKTSLFALFLLGCAHTVEGTGPPPQEEKQSTTSGEPLAEGTTSPPETGKVEVAPAPATTTAPASTNPSPTPPTTPTTTLPPTPLLYGQTLLDRWCTQITQCATQGYPNYGPMASCEKDLTLEGKWSCEDETVWAQCASAMSQTNCGSNLPTICLACTGGQGAQLPP